MSWAAIGGLMGCSRSAAERRYAGSQTSVVQEAVEAEYRREAEDLANMLADEAHGPFVLGLYLSVLHRKLAALAPDEERAALAAFSPVLARALAGPPAVEAAEPANAAPIHAPPAPEPSVAGRPLWWRTIHDVAERHGVTTAELRDKSNRPLAHARFEAFYLLRAVRRQDGEPMYGLTQIGRIFGMDHTSVLHGLRRWEKLLARAVAS